MKSHIATLRFFSLLLLLPGLGGMILSAAISAEYLQTLPHWPVPAAGEVIPRDIHGVAVYQTEQESRHLNRIEFSSVGFLVLGAALGLIYLEKWSAERARAAEDDLPLAGSKS